jgi:transcription initiation factor TFIIB
MCAVLRELQNYNACPECNGMIVETFERGERACAQCGLIVGEHELDLQHPGKRVYTKADKEKKQNYCAPLTKLSPDIGLCTVIDRRSIKNPDLLRAAKIDSQLSWKDRNFLIAITELKRISYNLNIPSHIKKSALAIYKGI